MSADSVQTLFRLTILLVILGAAACGDTGPAAPTTFSWTEDVSLAEGRSIRVARSASVQITNSMSGDSYNAVETEATLAFTGDLAQLPAWSQPLMAIVLYLDDSAGEWVVVATTNSCTNWRAPR
jgi:hypothetical protein